ncbi:hypothetical protein [Enterobacter hormaechei]|uniref:hypothetical protein n=1 Tax=Enterobacter hormaechei TaxID=158836 RepID=UPI00388F5FBF
MRVLPANIWRGCQGLNSDRGWMLGYISYPGSQQAGIIWLELLPLMADGSWA